MKWYMNNGISMVSLIITIIVMIILTGAILISSFGEDSIIMRAQEASFKSDIATFKQELDIYKTLNDIEVLKNLLNKEGYNEIKMVITSFKNEYEKICKIINNELVYLSDEGKEYQEEWARQVEITIKKEKVQIKITIQGEGIVEGDGEYSLLDMATLNATAGSITINGTVVAYSFEGWYQDGKIVTTDLSADVQATGDETYTVVFTPTSSLIYYVDQNGIEQLLIDNNSIIKGYTSRTDITKIQIGANCTSLGAAAFSGCTSLSSVKLSNSVKMIDDSAFAYCVLDEIQIPKDCFVSYKSFCKCEALETVNMPGAIFESTGRQFKYCTKLKAVTIGSIGNPTINVVSRLLQYCTQSDLIIKVYIESGTTSLTYAPWGATNATIEYYDATTGIKIN